MGSDKSFAGNVACFEDIRHFLGLNFKHPLGSSKLAYYARAGALYNHIETENSKGDVINDSKHGWGYQLAGGLAIPLSEKWCLTPDIKFNSLIRDSKFEDISKTLDYQFISFRIGIARRF